MTAPREECLARARDLTMGDRNDAYGPVAPNFDSAAVLWSGYKGVPFTGQDVAVMQALLKISRIKASPTHMDSHDDAAAYMAIAWECSVDAMGDSVKTVDDAWEAGE